MAMPFADLFLPSYNHFMTSPQPARIQFRIWPTIIAVIAILIIGSVIVYLDREQVAKLSSGIDLRLIVLALFFTALAYFLGSASFVAMLRLFKVHLEWPYLMRLSWLSIIQHNLIALPAALSFRMLLLGGCGVRSSTTLGASLLLVYFKDLALFALIPFSMLFVAVTGNFSGGGVAVLLGVAIIVAAGILTAGLVYFNRNLRTPVLETVTKLWQRLLHRDISASINRFEEALDGGLRRFQKQKKQAVILISLVLGDVAATIITLWFCFAALGIEIKPGVLVAGFNLGVTLAIVPFVPTQLGFQDASMAAIFALFGVPFSYGILGAILFRAVFYFVPFVVSSPLYVHVLHETRKRAACLLQNGT
jgi:uncharacterized protein (TIRG00374 family)